MSLRNRKVLIGITGSIAAYKIPILIRLLVKEGAEVRIVMTPAACDFVTPLTLSTLSSHPVQIKAFDKDSGAWHSHIELGNWGDVFLIAPVSANTLSKMANGFADNLLLTTYLAAKCPVFFAPAMDLDMFKHPATQKNVSIIQSFGHHLIEPREGELASGLCGAGRMEEPEEIVQILKLFFLTPKSFKGKRVLVTAGPTQEAIDPVRYIGNYSSGKMGFALAEEMASRGAEVTLITGPVVLQTDCKEIHRIDVMSANEMFAACKEHSAHADIIMMAAAVADFRPTVTQSLKIKKGDETPVIHLTKTDDILGFLGSHKKPDQVIIGFALETDNELENASVKLKNKNMDIIVLNSLADNGAGFSVSTNVITIMDNSGQITPYSLKSKLLVARDIVDYLHEFINKDA